MLVPIKWLKDYVDIVLPIEELAHRLTMAGLEVAAIKKVGDWWTRDRLFVGQVLEVRPHPNADRLTIVVVDYGRDEPLAVVTGAPNLKVGDKGQKVVLALAGARLIDGHSQELRYITLRPASIRGVRSEGMVCSEKELGLSEEHEGIIILDPDAPVGVPAADYLGDVVLELEITPNLARCLSIIGVAREVAALTGGELHLPSPEMQAQGPPVEELVAIEIADPDLCPRYSATVIRGVRVGPSPYWMQHRLRLAGMRPINNIVDITNYVMLEWGQPLHAFDYDKLTRKDGFPRIIVRRARPGECIVTLDGVERELDEEMLLITDEGGPIAIAGVMGGLETEVTEDTTNVLLESANFNFINNRRTSQLLKLPSEASARFGRGVDPELTVVAARRASELIRQLAGGVIAKGIADAYPLKPPTKVVEITPAEVERILGMKVSAERILKILESLDFSCQVSGSTIRATVPSYRLDVSLPADLIEEIARVIGYENIPTAMMREELPAQWRNEQLEFEEKVRDILVGCGLQEVITYSMVSGKHHARLLPGERPTTLEGERLPCILPPERCLRLTNPLSPEREYMRTTLLGSLLEVVRDNLRFRDRVAVFEVGRVYLPREGELLPEEPHRLGIALTGPRYPLSWLTSEPQEMDFFDLKGVVEELLAHLGVEEALFEPAQHPTFHPGRTARLLIEGQDVGILGEVHPLVREAFDIPEQRVGLAELDLDRLMELTRAVRAFRPPSRFPAVVQDIAVVVDEDVPAYEVRQVILRAGGELLRQAVLFDVYRGDPIPPGKKSLAYSLAYQAPDRTLTDEEVGRIRARILEALTREVGGTLRT